jgi:hypothetical protein
LKPHQPNKLSCFPCKFIKIPHSLLFWLLNLDFKHERRSLHPAMCSKCDFISISLHLSSSSTLCGHLLDIFIKNEIIKKDWNVFITIYRISPSILFVLTLFVLLILISILFVRCPFSKSLLLPESVDKSSSIDGSIWDFFS